MDGRENENQQGNSPAQPGAGGIYSTPDLTVDANRIQTNQATDASRARIASVFANTDAGQNSQRLNNAMGFQSQPVTEDVIIDNGRPKKRGMMPVILAFAVVILVALGVGVYAVVRSGTGGGNSQVAGTPKETFAKYYEYLKDGPEGQDGGDKNSDSYYLFGVAASQLQNSEIQEYDKGLSERYGDFFASTQKRDFSDEEKQTFSEYQSLLSFMITYSSLSSVKAEFQNKYIRDGQEAASAYVDELTKSEEGISTLKNVLELLQAYFTDEYRSMQIYEEGGCLDDGELNIFCTVELENTNASYNEIIRRQLGTREALSQYESFLQGLFIRKTNEIKEVVEK